MIRIIYYIILIYFLLGGIGFYVINRKRPPEVAKKSYTKFIAYFFIINILFFSIVINPQVFRYLTIVIIVTGLYELFRLFRMRGYRDQKFYVLALLIFMLLSSGFFLFSGSEKELILFSFLVLSVFDSFSQITGQLWGKTKILPHISPNKTLGGVVGGAIIAVASSLVFKSLYNGTIIKTILLATGIVVFAFIGDLAASLYKRKYGVKDYSNLIPGHGGFLDRFDSLIAGGAWVAFYTYILAF